MQLSNFTLNLLRSSRTPLYLLSIFTFGLGTGALAQTVAPHTTVWMVPASFVTATSNNGTGGNGTITLIDVSGDDPLDVGHLLSGASLGFALDPSAQYGQSIQDGQTFNDFANGTNMNINTIGTETPPGNSCQANLLYPTPQSLFVLDYKSSRVNIGYPLGSSPNNAMSIAGGPIVGTTPVVMTGDPVTQRYFVVSQNIPYGVACNNIPHNVSASGSAAVFDGQTGSTSGTVIPVGKCPVFGVTSSDGRRSFIVNRGDDSISVINVANAAPDTNSYYGYDHSTIQLPLLAGTNHAGPVYAEYVPHLAKLLIANYENDTVSVVNVQVDSTNIDGPQFGTVVATIDLWNGISHVGQSKHPTTIAALPDASRAYVTNQSDGTVSVIDLSLNEVVSTLPLGNGTHPRSVVAVSNADTNSLFAKLYVAAPDGSAIPWIYAQDNVLLAPTCPNSNGVCAASGNVTDVRASAQNYTSQYNNINWTRLPGAGAPCATDLPNPDNLAACQSH